MSMSQFSNIRVILAEPNAQLRDSMLDCLNDLGFRDAVPTGNMSRIAHAVQHDEVDMIIADTSLPEGDFNSFVTELRHGHRGLNPFLVVVTLVSEPSRTAVQAAINSGTDHVLAKPFNAEALLGKLNELVQARKRFVVTSDYIGPDRRAMKRTGSMEIPLIDVPNPLHYRLGGQISDNQIKRNVDAAVLRINEQKVQRHAYQVGWLLDSVMPEIAAMNQGLLDGDAENLERLRDVAQDMCTRIKGTRYAHVAEMCLTLSRMANQAACKGLCDQDVKLMGRMAGIVAYVFNPERDVLAADYHRRARARGVSIVNDEADKDLTRKALTPMEVAAVAVG